MADIRIKDLTNTAISTAADDYLALDGATNGSRKMLADTLMAPVGTLSNLTTTDKTDLVSAINEVDADLTDVKADLSEQTRNLCDIDGFVKGSVTVSDGVVTGTAGAFHSAQFGGLLTTLTARLP